VSVAPETEATALSLEPERDAIIVGRSPWGLAGRRLLHNRLALAALVLFLLIVGVSFAAPFYAKHVARTDPFVSNLSGTIRLHGKKVSVIQQGTGKLGLGETPIGPTWRSHYLLGADSQGRDVAARVLYGGRASLPWRTKMTFFRSSLSRGSSASRRKVLANPNTNTSNRTSAQTRIPTDAAA